MAHPHAMAAPRAAEGRHPDSAHSGWSLTRGGGHPLAWDDDDSCFITLPGGVSKTGQTQPTPACQRLQQRQEVGSDAKPGWSPAILPKPEQPVRSDRHQQTGASRCEKTEGAALDLLEERGVLRAGEVSTHAQFR
jgi:hypothetical protein